MCMRREIIKRQCVYEKRNHNEIMGMHEKRNHNEIMGMHEKRIHNGVM